MVTRKLLFTETKKKMINIKTGYNKTIVWTHSPWQIIVNYKLSYNEKTLWKQKPQGVKSDNNYSNPTFTKSANLQYNVTCTASASVL